MSDTIIKACQCQKQTLLADVHRQCEIAQKDWTHHIAFVIQYWTSLLCPHLDIKNMTNSVQAIKVSPLIPRNESFSSLQSLSNSIFKWNDTETLCSNADSFFCQTLASAFDLCWPLCM